MNLPPVDESVESILDASDLSFDETGDILGDVSRRNSKEFRLPSEKANDSLLFRKSVNLILQTNFLASGIPWGLFRDINLNAVLF